MRGDRDLYTPEALERFETALGAGLTLKLACSAAGWSYRAFHDWRAAAEADPEDKHHELPAVIARARARRAETWMAVIMQAAGAGDWKAAAWMAERLEPDDYGRREAVTLAGPAGGPVRVDVVQARPALEAAARELDDAALGLDE